MEKGARLGVVDVAGRTPAAWAAHGGHVDVLDTLQHMAPIARRRQKEQMQRRLKRERYNAKQQHAAVAAGHGATATVSDTNDAASLSGFATAAVSSSNTVPSFATASDPGDVDTFPSQVSSDGSDQVVAPDESDEIAPDESNGVPFSVDNDDLGASFDDDADDGLNAGDVSAAAVGTLNASLQQLSLSGSQSNGDTHTAESTTAAATSADSPTTPTAAADAGEAHSRRRVVGKIELDLSQLLRRRGADGSRIYAGEYEQRQAAIKCVPRELCGLAEREIHILCELSEDSAIQTLCAILARRPTIGTCTWPRRCLLARWRSGLRSSRCGRRASWWR